MNALTRLIVWLLTMLYSWVLKPFYRYSILWATGKGDIERLLERDTGTGEGAASVLVELETVMRESQKPEYAEIVLSKDLSRASEFAKFLVETEKVSDKTSSTLVKKLEHLLPVLLSYNDLVARVETLRKTAYNADDAAHESELLSLWDHLVPDRKLKARVSPEWGEIGFQGDDPKTDFRGMGILGLKNLSFFASDESHQDSARRTLSRSHHPEYWYSWAIVGINLTSLCVEFLNEGHFKRTLYARAMDLGTRKCDLASFHVLFSAIFVAFDDYWLRQRKSVMEFNGVRQEFRLALFRRLRAGIHVERAVKDI